jgi:methionine-rich copper-binding protein CopC
MMIRRSIAALALAGLALVAAATPAFAHAELTSSNPAKDASVAQAPSRIQLTFNETVSPESITVTGPQGAQWTVGQIAVEGPVVTAPVIPAGPAGQYTITYRVLSDDGASVTGTVAFTLTSPATASAPPSSGQAAPGSSGDSKGLPAWLWVLAIAVLLGAGAVIGRRVRRPS